MPSRDNAPDVARVLRRAAEECGTQHEPWLGPGLPDRLRPLIHGPKGTASADLAFIEVTSVSPTGLAISPAAVEESVPATCRFDVVGITTTPYEALASLVDPQITNHDGIAIRRLICPFAVFDFGPTGIVVREIRHGLTAVDLQRSLGVPLWAGPDLKELSTH